jgi:hypothetical protein
MKKIIAALLLTVTCLSCSKSVPTQNGTINGLPALTLYGSSKQPADYLFISTPQKKVSYNGQVLSYTNAAGNDIFLTISGSSIARCTFDTIPKPDVLTIDTTYGFTFGSKIYTAK